jgi:uncharacterized SAM-binding protein YcdF (DUF218 family)
MKKAARIPWLVLAAALLALAAFFRFSLVGYGTTALCLAGLAVVVVLYLLLPKKLRIVLTALLLAGALVFTAAEVPVVRAARGTPALDADWLIVLGAGVNGTAPSRSMLDRLTAARDYLEAHPDCRAVLTGGQGRGEDVTEARAMADWLCARGVDPGRLVLEEAATTTLENLRFSFARIPDAAHARIAVCSSEYHLCRAETMARALGVEVGGVPGRTDLPVLRLNYFIREAFGMVYLRVFGI